MSLLMASVIRRAVRSGREKKHCDTCLPPPMTVVVQEQRPAPVQIALDEAPPPYSVDPPARIAPPPYNSSPAPPVYSTAGPPAATPPAQNSIVMVQQLPPQHFCQDRHCRQCRRQARHIRRQNRRH